MMLRELPISTGTICHLDASMITGSLTDWDLAELDFLSIENVGNLVCPASYDLGENIRAVLLAVTEGEDKPLKYPTDHLTSDSSASAECGSAGTAIGGGLKRATASRSELGRRIMAGNHPRPETC